MGNLLCGSIRKRAEGSKKQHNNIFVLNSESSLMRSGYPTIRSTEEFVDGGDDPEGDGGDEGGGGDGENPGPDDAAGDAPFDCR